MNNPTELNDEIDDAPGEQSQEPIISTTLLREKVRDYSLMQRELKRHEAADSLRFGLGEIFDKIAVDNLTAKDVAGLAGRIKRRKHANEEDLYRLSHAFLQGEENINSFISIPGALQILVKELTGNDERRQLSAAETLCNLSLGQSHVCDKIVNAAGSYLVTYLDSTELRLRRLSLWTITNLISTQSKKVTTVLLQMQLFVKLWSMYTNDSLPDNTTNDLDFRQDAGLCLQLIALQTNVIALNTNDLIFILQNINTKNPTCSAGEYHLLLLLHSGVLDKIDDLQQNQVVYIINYCLSNLINCQHFNSNENRLRILYAVRTLANLFAKDSREMSIAVWFMQQVSSTWQINLANLLNKIFAFGNQALTKENLWLLKNLIRALGENALGQAFLGSLQVLKSNLNAGIMAS